MNSKLDHPEKQVLGGRESFEQRTGDHSIVGFQKGEDQDHESEPAEGGILREVPSDDLETFCKLCGRTATGRVPTNSTEIEDGSMKLGPLYELVVDEANEVC
jgi:hypothetical protein